MAHLFICPHCGHRETPSARTAGFGRKPTTCEKCGFGFLFELMDDYYPAPDAAFFVTDGQGRLIGCGRGSYELTGLAEERVMGQPIRDALRLQFENGDDQVATALEWGVRVLNKKVSIQPDGDRPAQAVADVFPAYDGDGGLLVVLTPAK
jgi:PAS domain-containing protein